MNGPLYMKNPTIEIELSNTDEYVATIDEADYDLVSPFRWRLHSGGYVSTGYIKGDHDNFKLLHRHLLGLGKGRVPEVDHVDRNPLNNCRSNLRLVTRSQNILNTGEYNRIHQLPKGVYLMPAGNYQCMIADPYAQASHALGMGLTPLLNEHEHYSQYWNNKGVSRVVAVRSPIVHHGGLS